MPSTPATLSSLLTQMYQNKEVLQGWDAVLNLLEGALNTFFQKQWTGMTHGAGRMSIATVWCEGVNRAPGGQGYFTVVHCFRTDLGPPLFEFQSGQAQVTVRQNILSGSLSTGTMAVPANFNPATCNCTPDDSRVAWGASEQVDTVRGPFLSGTVPLTQVQGLVSTTTESVVLQFAEGAFALNALSVPSVSSANIANALKNWFTTNRISYCLASIDRRPLGVPPGLAPKSFRFNVLKTNSGNTIVQLLISTDGPSPSSTSINVSEPIPSADGFTCSLMLSSRILYQEVLAPGFNRGGGQFALRAQPDGPAGSWAAFLSPQMHFAGSFSYGDCCNRKTDTYSIYLGLTFRGSPGSGFAISQHVHASGNAPVDIDVSGQYPVALSGSGEGQSLTITPGNPNVSVSGSVEDQIKSGLQGILQNNVRTAMAGVSFAPVSLLALQSILFPGYLMSMRQAQVPTDLVVVGTFQPN
jgi:hypothetical protein